MWFKKKEKPRVSEIDTIVIGYKTLELSSLRKVFSSDMSIIQINVYKSSIEEYSSYLRSMINAFEEEKQLATFQALSEVKSVYIRDFFVGSSNQNLKPVESMQVFIELVARFLDIYQSAERSANKSFIIEKNLHLTSGAVTNLIMLYSSFKTL